MSGTPERSRRLIRVVLVGIGRAAATAAQVFGAAIKAASGGGNAPLLPPSTENIPPRTEYRP